MKIDQLVENGEISLLSFFKYRNQAKIETVHGAPSLFLSSVHVHKSPPEPYESDACIPTPIF
jgi:hypothetical protein